MPAPAIRLDDIGLTITEEFDEGTFLSSALSKGAKPLVQNGPYHSFYTESHRIGGKLFVLSLFFANGQLQSVHLSPKNDKTVTWEDVSHDQLRKAKEANDCWIVAQFPDASQSRGTESRIESVYDEKSWSAEVVITYRSGLPPKS